MNTYAKIFIQHLLCAASFFVAAFACCAAVLAAAGSRDWAVMLFTAPLSAAVIALIFWALLTSLGRQVKVWKGILVGVLAGSVSHFFAWYLSIVIFYLQGAQNSLGEPTVGIVEGVGASLVMTFFSLALAGWLTIPVGALVGAALAALSGRFLSNRFS